MNPNRPRYTTAEAVSLPKVVKPATGGEERARAATGLPGVKGGGAHGKSSGELGRSRQQVKNRLEAGNHTPLPALIERMNRNIKGWANYFSLGYPRAAYRDINAYARQRLTRHLKRRSQRSYRFPSGESAYAFLNRMGLVYL